MLSFMDYVQHAFSTGTDWNRDNSYGTLTATARAFLDFPTPNGLSLNLSSLSSPNFATSYTLSSTGSLTGWLSYLYTSLPLRIPHRTADLPLRHLVPGYRHLRDLRRPDESWQWEVWRGGRRIDRRNALLYGRMFLPESTLEALYLRRLSPSALLKVSCVSSKRLRSGGSMLVLLSQDRGKYSTEYLYSTDSALLGARGLYNFGLDPRETPDALATPDGDALGMGLNGRFSAGAEVYYGLLNKSGGVSTGIRFATLPRHVGFPYTMTLTLNPLMGNLSSTYAVKASSSLALCSRFDFNVYSYESGFQMGMELWRRRQSDGDVGWARAKLLQPGKSGWGEVTAESAHAVLDERTPGPTINLDQELGDSVEEFRDEDTANVLKARLNQDGQVGLLWEGKVKELLYSFGVNIDFRRREQIFRGVGLEFRYSS